MRGSLVVTSWAYILIITGKRSLLPHSIITIFFKILKKYLHSMIFIKNHETNTSPVVQWLVCQGKICWVTGLILLLSSIFGQDTKNYHRLAAQTKIWEE